MYVPEIIEVKKVLESLKDSGQIQAWELPYENILTRRSAAVFFLTPVVDSDLDTIWMQLSIYDEFSYRVNTDKRLSILKFRVTFSKEEKEKNVKLIDGFIK